MLYWLILAPPSYGSLQLNVIYDDDALTNVIAVGAFGIAAGVIANGLESGPSPYALTAEI